MMLRRVVVTGIGIVSPLGCDSALVWDKLLRSHCGISTIEDGKLRKFANVHARVQGFDSLSFFGRNVQREYSLPTQYALYASDAALSNAKLRLGNQYDDNVKAGVAIASGGIGSIEDISEAGANVGTKKISPYFIPKILPNMGAGLVSIRHGLRGPVHSVATACAAGAHAIGDAFNFIRLGMADMMIAGGSESNMNDVTFAGFSRMRALSSSKDPLLSCRPFDEQRDGFVLGEGACLLVLEDLSRVIHQNREECIIAEICGYGLSGDAHHPTSPNPNGHGAVLSMQRALFDGSISPSQVGYVNAHATATQAGDLAEARAIEKVFEERRGSSNRLSPLFISSTKGATGHLLGAAGAIESAFTCLAIRDGVIPPTLNLVNPLDSSHEESHSATVSSFSHAPNCIVYNTKSNCDLVYAIKNSFGFGGTNVSLLFKKYYN